MSSIDQAKADPDWSARHAVFLGVILAAHLVVVLHSARGVLEQFDAVHLYLPLAHELAAKGWLFFRDERSLQAPPFSYVYPLLLGADIDRIKVVNALASAGTLIFVFQSTALIASRRAGYVAAILFAASPILRPHLAAPMTEAPFIFFTALWFWGMTEWLCRRRKWGLWLSALALTLASLTRAPIFYWNVLLLIAASFVAIRSSGQTRGVWGPVAVASAGALVLPGFLILKNVFLFDFPFYATGGGNALYLGNNPLTGGYDSNYLGLAYDVGAIARNQSHLTLEAERLLRGAAGIIFSDKSLSFLATMYFHKAAAFVFVTNAEPFALIARSWRILLLTFAIPGIFLCRHQAARWVLFGVFATLVGLHVPVLYTHRYSVSAVDLWLTIAAAIGAVALFEERKRFLIAVGAATAGIALGVWSNLYLGKPMPNVFEVGRLLVWSSTKPLALQRESVVEVRVSNAPWFRTWNNHVLVAELKLSEGTACHLLRASYATAPGNTFSEVVSVPIRGSGRYQIGGTPLGLDKEGVLRVSADCDGAVIEAMQVYAALGAIDYRARFLHEAPPLPIER